MQREVGALDTQYRRCGGRKPGPPSRCVTQVHNLELLWCNGEWGRSLLLAPQCGQDEKTKSEKKNNRRASSEGAVSVLRGLSGPCTIEA